MVAVGSGARVPKLSVTGMYRDIYGGVSVVT